MAAYQDLIDQMLDLGHRDARRLAQVAYIIGGLSFDVDHLDEYTPATLRNILRRVQRELQEAVRLEVK